MKGGKPEKKFNGIGKYIGDLFDPGFFKSVMRHGRGLMEYLNGEKYDGMWKMNQRHGYGVMIYKNGDIYSGNWENDKKNGSGQIMYQNGEKLFISWKDDVIIGKGAKHYLNGDIYNGNFWLNGIRHGEGTYIYKNGDKFIGNWHNDLKNGTGQIVFDNKYHASGVWLNDTISGTLLFQGNPYKYNTIETDTGIYDGLFKNDIFHGFGRFYFKNGSIYTGLWDNGVQMGNGKFINQQGDDIFVGNFKNGVFINGTLVRKNGDIYIGNFDNYVPVGTIIIEYKNGDKYKGQIKDWQKSIYGELITKEGNQYIGEFANNIINGKGTLKKTDSNYEGQFKNGLYHGIGTITYDDYIYIGNWVNGKKNGSGEIKYPNGTILTSNFIDDNINGKVKCNYIDGSIYIGFWSQNYATGQGHLTHMNGDIYEGNFSYGKKNGIGQMIYADKSVYDGTWHNDYKVNGTLVFQDGRKYEGFFNYKNTIEKGRVFFPNGDKYNGEFSNYYPDRHGRMEYKNGNIYEGTWSNNKANGKGTMTYSNGDIYTGSWSNGNHTMGNWNIESVDKLKITNNKKILDTYLKSWGNILNLQIFTYTKIIDEFYDNFINLGHSSKEISCLRQNSSNGFIRFVEFYRLGYRIKLVLKSTILDVKGYGDNLLYEYLVGRCVNRFCDYFPNFIRTYGSYQYKNQSKYDYILTSCSKLSKRLLPENLEYYLYNNSYENLNDNIINGCKNNKYMCVLTQYVPYQHDLRSYIHLLIRGKTFERQNITQLIKILYMTYAPLKVLSNHYTHYDLHDKNILLYEVPNNQYIDIKYYKNEEDYILIQTKYIPVIIDYGRSWIDCKFFDKELLNSNEIINIVCDNTEECNLNCGKEVGFDFIGNRRGRDFLDTDHNKFFINTAKRNKSHDLRLLNIFKNYDYRNLNSKIEYIEKWLELLTNLIYHNEFGTPEINGLHQSKITNVESAYNALEAIISSGGFEIDSLEDIEGLHRYTTMNIYLYDLKNRTIE